MPETVVGHVLTIDQARELGVLGSAPAIVRDDPNKPWRALTPSRMPVEVETQEPEEDSEEMAEEPKHNVSLYRALHHLKKGGLHRALGIPEGEKIPEAKLEAAKHSQNEHVRHMANFAGVMSGFH